MPACASLKSQHKLFYAIIITSKMAKITYIFSADIIASQQRRCEQEFRLTSYRILLYAIHKKDVVNEVYFFSADISYRHSKEYYDATLCRRYAMHSFRELKNEMFTMRYILIRHHFAHQKMLRFSYLEKFRL